MKTEQDYDKAFQIVKKAVHAWDPYCLMESGAPEDEFDSEIASLLTYIQKVSNVKEFGIAISKVFGQAFGKDGFTEDKCADFARELFGELKKNSLLNKAD